VFFSADKSAATIFSYFHKTVYICKMKTTTKPTMKKDEGYELNADYKPEIVQFRFTSVSDERSIEKIIEFSYIPNRPWNLGFGDVKGNDWEDNIVSNNKDYRKVLQTVANAVHQFCDLYPSCEIAIQSCFSTEMA
jgi:hypothetical protein